jgi:glutathione peroxidase
MTTFHDFSANTLAGEKTALSTYKGKVALVVNTASRCGLTPQYAGLEALHRKFADKGLAVLGFPCNQFGAQEPGTAEVIAAFCEKNYGVSFPLFEKLEVNGGGAHPLYQWLKKESAGAAGSEDIEWNFAKFLVGRDGNLIRRYAPKTRPEDMAADIEALLG